MAITQIPRYSNVIQADDNNTVGTIVVRDSGGSISVSGVSATSITNSGPHAVSLITRTTNYTASTETVILCNATSAAITITLPAASGVTGRVYTIKKIDSSGNNVTIDGSGTETIDGAATVALSTQWHFRTIVSDGTSWFVVARD